MHCNCNKKILVMITAATSYFVSWVAYSIIGPFFPNQARERGLPNTIIGFIFSLYPAVTFIMAIPVAKAIVRWGAKVVLIAGYILLGGGLVFFGYSYNIPSKSWYVASCMITRVVSGLGGTCLQVTLLSIITDAFKDNVGVAIGIVTTFICVGLTAGPGIGGILYKAAGNMAPYYFCGVSSLVTLVTVACILPSEKQNKELGECKNMEEDQGVVTVRAIITIPGVIVMAYITSLNNIMVTFYEPLLSVRLKEISKDMDAQKIGFVYLIAPFTGIIAAPVVGFFTNKLIKGRYIVIIGHFLNGTWFLLLGPSPLFDSIFTTKTYLICVSMALLGLTISFTYIPNMDDMLNSIRERGIPVQLSTNCIVSGILDSSLSFGAIIGPNIGGALTQSVGFPYATTILAAILMLSGFLLLLFTLYERWKKLKRDNSSEELSMLLNGST